MKLPRFEFFFLISLTLTLYLAACNLNSAMQPATPDLLATSVHQTASVLLSQVEQTSAPSPTIPADPTLPPTQESLPTQTLPPTTDPGPSATPLLEDNRIRFAPSTTFATVRGEVLKDQPKQYLLQINQGQLLSLFIESEYKSPLLALSGVDGEEILSADQGYIWYVTTIQKTQDYLVSIVPTDEAANFILHVSTPIEVNFDKGATSKTFQGMIQPDDIVEFRAYALKDQQAIVTLTSVSGKASLHIYGLTDLVSYVDRKSGQTSWTASLPKSQNYMIRVLANDQPTEFSVKIEFLNP